MAKVLVIQGAGMNMRGKAQVEISAPTPWSRSTTRSRLTGRPGR